MGFKDKVSKYFTDAYMQKYGDRMTSTAGTVLSVKIEEKNILGIFRKLNAIILLKPDAGKGVVKTQYKVRKWLRNQLL